MLSVNQNEVVVILTSNKDIFYNNKMNILIGRYDNKYKHT